MRLVNLGLVAAVFAVASTACTALPDEGRIEQEALSTNLTAYTQGDSIVVTYSNMGGAATDWISLARTTDDATIFEAWQYTGGGDSGVMTFTAPGIAPGTYEARAYFDWSGTESYTIQQRSPSFTVDGTATLAATATSYPINASVPINFSGFSGSATDWISIHHPGTADTNYVDWQFTGGGTTGQLTFANLPSGIYEARYHADWQHTNSYATSATSPQFSVNTSPAVATDQLSYGVGQTVTLTYSNMPGNQLDYVAVSTAGSAATSTVQRFYINGQINGSQAFSGLATGSYEARAYVNDSSTIIAMSTFSISTATVTTDASSYPSGSPVVVSYTGLPGNPMDWIAIAAAGSADTSYVDFQYSNGQASGMATFASLPPGTYEARVYFDNSFVVAARSAVFTIGGASCQPGTSPVLASIATGDLLIPVDGNEASAALTVPLDASVLFVSMREREQSPQYGATMCDLHAADATAGTAAGVTCRRNTIGTDTAASTGEVRIHWAVATFTSGVSVQRGILNTFAANPATATLSPAIDTASTFTLMNGMFTGGTGWGNNEFTRAQLIDGSTLQVRQSAAGAQVAWQVVTMTGASVQRGTTTIAPAATSGAATITAVPSGSFVLASYTTDNPSGIAASSLMLATMFADPNTVSFTRVAGGPTMDISWEVVSLPFATHTGVSTFNAGVAARTEPVDGIAADSSVALGTTQSVLGQSCGSTDFGTTDLLGETAATLTAASGSLVLERASSTARATIPWTVIDFAHDCAGN